MSVIAPPWGYGRLFLTFLTVVDHEGFLPRSVLSAHVPEMRITVRCVPEIDTGGERRC